MVDLDVQLPADLRSPARARHALDDVESRIPSDVLERFRLAVTELVTNAILHAGLSPNDVLNLVVRISDHQLRVEVTNAGASFDPTPRPVEPMGESGRGLMLVERTTDRWGMKRADGVRLWFEIDLPTPERTQLN
jgi:anti-sigma regulatory factor (Ser/Thr protein kinase)